MSLRKLAMIAAISSAALTAFAAPAQAADRNLVGEVVLFVHSDDTVSTKSRADVLAELMAAQTSGALSRRQGEVVFPGVEASTGPFRSREAVQQEAIAASRAGKLSQGEVVLH